ncbi:MAG: hypothetical protein NT033_08375 [Candidatus Omnitrophica bacterium]|nr:hypothetical protein [Candidatus Omnitrophota bacterium]
MIRKIIILGLIIMAGYFFYKKYMASTLEPFFREKKGNVDFLGLGPSSLDKAKINP